MKLINETNNINSKLALGTVQFGLDYGIANRTGQVSESEAKQIIDLALKNHITTLDTAIGYGNSEQCLGNIGIQPFNTITKLPALPKNINSVSTWVEQQISESLVKLNISKIYGLLLHKPMDLLQEQGNELYRSLLRLKEKGLVKKIGISIYSPEELDKLIPNFQLDIIQAPLNIIDRRLQTSGWLKKLKDWDIEVHTRSVFLQGLLLMPKNEIPLKFLHWENLWNTWHTYLNEISGTALATSLAYPLSINEVDHVLVGVDSIHQLEDIIKSSNHIITAFPDIAINDEKLINPANWTDL